METTPIYRGLKERLNTVAPVFRFIGQYVKGKENTTYKVPALYIELPGSMNIDFLPGRLQVAKGCEVKIHLITNAPYKVQDNLVQDEAIDKHDLMLNTIDRLITGWFLKNRSGNLLTEQFIPSNQSGKIFEGVHCISLLTFRTSFYHRS